MIDREKLIEILRVPIYPRIKAETAEAVADYLIDNDVVPVVHCKYCKYWKPSDARGGDSVDDMQTLGGCEYVRYCRREKDFCSYGERKEE